MKNYYASFICLLLFSCTGASNVTEETKVGIESNEIGKLEYSTLHNGEPVSINLEKQTVIYSDYGVESDFCGLPGDFCIKSPFISSAYSSVSELADSLAAEGWELQEERVTAAGTRRQIRFISADRELIWQSTYAVGNEYPVSIIYMKSESVDPDQPILVGFIRE